MEPTTAAAGWTGMPGHARSRRSRPRPATAWTGADRVEVVPPSIDAFSPKNQSLEPAAVDAILSAAGIVGRPDGREPGFVRQDGSPGVVRRRARMIEDHPVPPDAPVVVQVSR